MNQSKQSAIERLREWKKNYPVEPHSDSENPEDWAMISGYCYKAYEIALDLAKELDNRTNPAAYCELEAELAEAKEAIAKRDDLLGKLIDHLNYCGWGDSWERQGTEELQAEAKAWQKLKADEAKGGDDE